MSAADDFTTSADCATTWPTQVPVSGTATARLSNFYAVGDDHPAVRSGLENALYRDEELLAALEDDRRRNVSSHLTADKAAKAFLLELSKYERLVKGTGEQPKKT